MLLPALAKARSKAHTLKCASNQKQLGTLIKLYSSDYEDYVLPCSMYYTYSKGLYGNTTMSNSYYYYLMNLGYTAEINYHTRNKETIFICPSTAQGQYGNAHTMLALHGASYGVNLAWSWNSSALTSKRLTKTTQVRKPSIIVYAADSIKSNRTDKRPYLMLQTHWTSTEYNAYVRHGRICNVLWMDGHVKGVTASSIVPESLYATPELKSYGTAWWNDKD
jgi:prepilin-type processing-associated H-X9-DG protein